MKEQLPSLDLLIYKILIQHSDENHLLLMSDLRAYCEDAGHPAERRTIYRSITMLQSMGIDIAYVRRGRVQGYYCKHIFSKSEALFLMNAICESTVLTKQETDTLLEKIRSFLPDKKIDPIPPLYYNPNKSNTQSSLHNIELLFPALMNHYYVEFLYFDITVTKKKKYRKEKEKYRLVPYAIVTENGRYYVVFYSDSHQSFANYRLDKMDSIVVTNDIAEGKHFSIEDHMRTSFQMYHGSPQTVTAIFPNKLSSIIFDQFGDNLVISKVEEETFTASIRTTVTPTLISWFLQFYDEITIVKPQSLIDEYQTIAQTIFQKYAKKSEE